MPAKTPTEEIDISDFQSLCAAIGFIEVNWALFEQSLDYIVITAHRDLGGSAIERKLPKTYSAKSEFLKKAFSKIVVLNPLKGEALEIFAKSDALSKKRNDLTHGVVTDVEVKDGVYNFSKIDYVGSDHSYRDFVFNPNDFPCLAQELTELGSLVTRLGIKVNELEERLSNK